MGYLSKIRIAERGGGYGNELILISNTVGFETIKEDLLKQGIKEENILILQEYNEKARKKQYFEKNCIGTGKEMKGCFVDIGCYDGEDVVGFYRWSMDESKHAVAFEADPYNYQRCLENLKEYKNVKLYNVGVSDKEESLKFKLDGSQSSRFTNEGNKNIITKPLDTLLKEVATGFIKMDVEGMEERVIYGAKGIIARDKPILAVSIYHKRSDIWEIPRLLLDINPEYRFYLRHYSLGVIDTVLYAVC